MPFWALIIRYLLSLLGLIIVHLGFFSFFAMHLKGEADGLVHATFISIVHDPLGFSFKMHSDKLS
jgi:hypothetical protein